MNMLGFGIILQEYIDGFCFLETLNGASVMNATTKILTLIIGIFVGPLSFAQSREKIQTPKCAILLHGLARTSGSMGKIEKALTKQGYTVWNKSYPSRDHRIQELSSVVGQGLSFCKQQNAQHIYFATHSLGGILVRHYFQNKHDSRVKAIVMIAPPNQGSELSEEFKDAEWFKIYSGIAGQQLGTSRDSFTNSLARISLPIGIIAGTKSSDPWFSHLFEGPNDGKVSVKSTMLPEMKDFIEYPAGHTFIMQKEDVIKQLVYFFDNQVFLK